MPRFSEETLREFVTRIFLKCQTPPHDAALVAQHLVESSLMGMNSHGLMRVPQYVRWIRESVLRPGSSVVVVRDHGATAVLDCNHNFGQVGAAKAVQLAIQRAQRHGVACVLAKNCGHTGRIGAYTQMAAEAGFLALAACSGQGGDHWVAPFGGRDGRLGTNPISFAAPTDGDPIVVDISTSMTSEGKVRLHQEQGRPLPAGWIIDHAGRPSCRAEDLYGPQRGAILPLGGPAGYKGFYLGLMVQILSTALAGESITNIDGSVEHTVFWLVVIDVNRFVLPDQFRALLRQLIDYEKSSAPSPGSDGVPIPGEREFQAARLQRKEGIEVHPDVWHQIVSVAGQLGVRVPTRLDALMPNRSRAPLKRRSREAHSPQEAVP